MLCGWNWNVKGAKAEALVNGVRLVLDGSGRKIAYNRSGHGCDRQGIGGADGIIGRNTIVPSVDDAGAAYPMRIDPTFSDEDWISNGGLIGANAVVRATVVDASGNLYIGGDFTIVGGVMARQGRGNGTEARGRPSARG